jgi:glycosyltransferase involved in cell wall biosynthesis
MTSSDHNNPLVSVIVTTRNEERNIGNCLKSIQLQTYKPIEIIVVDNNSTDKTKKVALGFTDVVIDKGPERSAQRNHGICDLATGQYAMFIDADMILSPRTIEACVASMKSEPIIGLHIPEVILGNGHLARIRRFERTFYSGTVIDGARFFLRSKFCEIGGFDESLPPGPEDWDLDKRLKGFGKILLLAKFSPLEEWSMSDFVQTRGVVHDSRYVGLYHNESEQSLAMYLKKKQYYSPSMAEYIIKWSKDDRDVRKQLGFKYRFLVVFIENMKWKYIVRNPLTFVTLLGLRGLVGFGYIINRARRTR